MPPRSLLSRAPAAFAVVLWFASTFFFLGDTGKHSDDYGVVMRDPATGAINLSHHPWVRWPYFWRPLHLAHASAINTISWDHPWIGHLELAVAHGLVAWMLMGLLTRLGVRRPISYAAALLFMACPLIAEAALWTSASCNAISCLFLFRTLELVRRQGAGPPTHIRTLWIALLSFITACWYEPGAAALAAVPFVCLAARARTIEPASAPASPWRGALRCTIAAGFGCLLYAALLLITAPPKTRGGSESLVTVANALSRTRWIFTEAAGATVGHRAHDLLCGSIRQGWHTLHSPAGWILALLAVILFPLACIAIARTPRPAANANSPATPIASRSGRGLIVCAGAAIFVCAWLPIVAVTDQVVELRSLYVPVLGLAILAAALANGAADLLAISPPRARRVVTTLAAVITLAGALAGATGMIGFQTQFRLNARHDRGAVEQLRRLVPDPPANTVFLPLRIDARGAATGRPCYDHAIHGAFEAPWSCRAIVRVIYRRADLVATSTPWWLKHPDPRGIRRVLDPALIPWDRCIPFTLDRDGTVHLISHLTVLPTGAVSFEVEFPRVPPAPVASARNAPARMQLREINRAHCVVEEIVGTRPVTR